MSDNSRICVDMILPHELRNGQPSSGGGPMPSGAISVFRKAWANGSELGVHFMDGTSEEHDKCRQWASQWSEFANIKFDFNAASDAEIRVSFEKTGRSWSYLGTDCLLIDRDKPTMNFGWTLEEGTVLHEFGHALSLGHEHQNPDGGIQWNEAAVIRDLSGSPNFWDEATIRHNVLKKYSTSQIRGTEFDPDSIMLYAFPGSWTVSGTGTKENDVLSGTDKSFIASTYKKPPGVKTLKVFEATATAASIGTPGEEDQFRFVAESPGTFTIETLGDSDVMMKLFGPDSSTKLIAEDDDSGRGLNPRIVRELATGEYLLSVRHFSRNSGTGDYGIRVTKT